MPSIMSPDNTNHLMFLATGSFVFNQAIIPSHSFSRNSLEPMCKSEINAIEMES